MESAIAYDQGPSGQAEPLEFHHTGQLDAIVVLYLILSFIGIASLLQFLGVYRERIRHFNSQIVRRFLQLITTCFEQRVFDLRPNEIMTRSHINFFELFVRSTIDFFYDAPNLITLLVGILQVLSTYDPENPEKAKVINLIALGVNYFYTMIREISMHYVALRFDMSRNTRVYKILASPSSPSVLGLSRASWISFDDASEWKPILSMDICAGDVLRMDYGETFPAESRVLHSTEPHSLVNTKEESGEECSSIVSVGDIVPYGSRVSMEKCVLIVQVMSTRNSVAADGQHRRMERFPEHMNKYLTVANLFGLGLLSLVAGMSVVVVVTTTTSTAHVNDVVFTHFFSILAQLNVLIPSTRWVILYFLYVFFIDRAYPDVTIQSHAAIRKLNDVQVVYTDKTGTLTDTKISVDTIQPAGGLEQLVAVLDKRFKVATKTECMLACILLSCNDCQPGNGEGTSPEEMVIAEYLRTRYECYITHNPLKPNHQLLKFSLRGEIFQIEILKRSGYMAAELCREAEILFEGVNMTVRQGGSDRMAALTGDKRTIEIEARDAKNNPNRAFGWTVTVDSVETPLYCARATFMNPPRDTSRSLIDFFTKIRIAVRMLTGDGLEAAKHIARNVGIHTDQPLVLRQDYGRDEEFFDAIETFPSNLVVLIEGAQLMKLLESNSSRLAFLQNRKVNMVIYRTKSVDKAVIVRYTAEFISVGCGMIGDAANDKHVLALPSIISVSLRHGAAPCRVVSDVVITEPGDLIDCWKSCQSLHLSGAKALLVNTCLVGALTASLTWVGIWQNSFALLRRGFLYPDPYDTRFMLLFSSVLFAPSACSAVLGRYSHTGQAPIKVHSWVVQFRGLALGLSTGAMAAFLYPQNFRIWLLIVMIVTTMISHDRISSSHTLKSPSMKIRTVVDFINRRVVRGVVVAGYSLLQVLVNSHHH